MPISIHAPREGCDKGDVYQVRPVGISIHAPREGCDLMALTIHAIQLFQSTHPVRGATFFAAVCLAVNLISIHAPREGCDMQKSGKTLENQDFNPRTP